MRDGMRHSTNLRILKYHEDIFPFNGREQEFHDRFKPYEVVEIKDNVCLEEGINRCIELICGTGSLPYSNAVALIGVGDGTITATSNQTGWQGGTYEYASMETGFPSLGDQAMRFKGSFASGNAEFAWREWAVVNGTASDKHLNRKQESMGEKTGGTWTLEGTITLS